MFGIYAYFVLMFFFDVVPLLFLWVTFYKRLLKYRKIFIFVILGSFLFGAIWDNLAIKNEVWYFPNTVNIRLLNLPIEEWFLMLFLSLLTSSLTLLMLEKGNK